MERSAHTLFVSSGIYFEIFHDSSRLTERYKRTIQWIENYLEFCTLMTWITKWTKVHKFTHLSPALLGLVVKKTEILMCLFLEFSSCWNLLWIIINKRCSFSIWYFAFFEVPVVVCVFFSSSIPTSFRLFFFLPLSPSLFLALHSAFTRTLSCVQCNV